MKSWQTWKYKWITMQYLSCCFPSDGNCIELSTFLHCVIQLSCRLWLGIVGRRPHGTELCGVCCKTGWEKGTARERSVHARRRTRHSVSFPFSTATGLVLPWGRGSGAVSSFWIKLVMCCKYLHRLASPSWLDHGATDRHVSGSGTATQQGHARSFSLTYVIVGMTHQPNRWKR